MTQNEFQLPVTFNVGAVFFFALTGAFTARRKGYDFIGAFVLAFVTGVGGGLLRDSLLRGSGPMLALTDPRVMVAILAATFCGMFRVSTRLGNFQRLVGTLDAIGLGAFAVVGANMALKLNLHWLAAVFLGVVNAVGGGLLRDLLTRTEPLLLKPGQFYALAALFGSCAYVSMTLAFQVPVVAAAITATILTVIFRILAIIFNWRTRPVEEPEVSP